MTDTPSGSSGRPSLVNELDDVLDDIGNDVLDDTGSSDIATVFLVGLGGRMAGKLFKIKPGESLIGRSSRSLIKIDEKAVSHKHARLRLNSDGCLLEDLESTNGTFLNDARLSSPQLLNAGDVIRLGNNAFGFLTDAADDQQHTRAMARLTSPRLAPASLAAPITLAPSTTAGVTGQLVPARYSSGESQGIQTVTAAPPEEEGNALDNLLDKLELVMGFLRRHRSTLIMGTVAGFLIGCGVAMMRPPPALAEFAIYLRQDATPDPTRPDLQRDLGLQGGEFFAFAEQKFSDPSLVMQTLPVINLPQDQGLAASIAARLTFSQVDRMGTFRGSFSDPDRAFAGRLLAAHLQTFLEAEINKALKVQASEVSLMRQEFEKNEAELDAVEKDLQLFKEKHLNALPEVAQMQIQGKALLLASRDRLVAEVTSYRAELDLAQRQLSSEEFIVKTHVDSAKPYKDALATVMLKVAEAEAQGLAKEHPELIALRAERTRLETLISRTIATETSESDRKSNPEYLRLKGRIGELSVMLGSSQQQLGQVEGRLSEIASISGQMPEVEADMTRLVRKTAAHKEIHERLLVELKGKELALKFERASVAARYEVMRPPHATQPPRSSSFIKFGGAGTAGGLFLGILLGLLKGVFKYARERKLTVRPPTSSITRIDDSTR